MSGSPLLHPSIDEEATRSFRLLVGRLPAGAWSRGGVALVAGLRHDNRIRVIDAGGCVFDTTLPRLEPQPLESATSARAVIAVLIALSRQHVSLGAVRGLDLLIDRFADLSCIAVGVLEALTAGALNELWWLALGPEEIEQIAGWAARAWE